MHNFVVAGRKATFSPGDQKLSAILSNDAGQFRSGQSGSEIIFGGRHLTVRQQVLCPKTRTTNSIGVRAATQVHVDSSYDQFFSSLETNNSMRCLRTRGIKKGGVRPPTSPGYATGLVQSADGR